MTVGSLFSGIGGFDLGFERAGFEIRWQVEIDPFCRRVLEKHWPNVRRYEDVRTIGVELERVDVICGGFPCQPSARGGKRLGNADERWLWPDFARIIRALRPGYIVMENVPGLLDTGLGEVLGDLASSGFDAEWDCIPARAFGAPHLRDRVWIIAYPERVEWNARPWLARALVSAPSDQLGGHCRFWESEPTMDRVLNGVPRRVDELRAIGGALVPQIAQWIAEQIVRVTAGATPQP